MHYIRLSNPLRFKESFIHSYINISKILDFVCWFCPEEKHVSQGIAGCALAFVQVHNLSKVATSA
jgi:hypothetical protein